MYFLAPKSLLTALIATVLATGGCLPCPRLFAADLSKRSCCNSKGECKRPSPGIPANQPCTLQLADTQSEPPQHSDRLADGCLAETGEPVLDSSPPSYFAVEVQGASAIDSSPPRLFLLHLSLLI